MKALPVPMTAIALAAHRGPPARPGPACQQADTSDPSVQACSLFCFLLLPPETPPPTPPCSPPPRTPGPPGAGPAPGSAAPCGLLPAPAVRLVNHEMEGPVKLQRQHSQFAAGPRHGDLQSGHRLLHAVKEHTVNELYGFVPRAHGSPTRASKSMHACCPAKHCTGKLSHVRPRYRPTLPARQSSRAARRPAPAPARTAGHTGSATCRCRAWR